MGNNKGEQMIPHIRRQTMLDLIRSKEVALLSDLVTSMGLSESTVRRDLKLLAGTGAVELLRGGGIRLLSANFEQDVMTKMLLQKEEKKRIARRAAELVEPGDILFLDPSTANSFLIACLVGKNVTVVTNSFMHINQLVKLGIRGFMIGGQIKTQTLSCVGVTALSAMKEYRFSKSFLGANGFDVHMGITNHDPNELHIKRQAMETSLRSYFLIDSSKYSLVNMCKVADINACTLITDKRLPELTALDNIIYAEK